jgi:hypothetical protein
VNESVEKGESLSPTERGLMLGETLHSAEFIKFQGEKNAQPK